MNNQNYSIIELDRENVMSFANYLPENKLEWVCKNNVVALGLLNERNRSCGALMYSFYPDEGTAYIESVCVSKSLREQGLGTMLYEDFEDRVYHMGIEEVGARVVIPAEGDAKCFLESVGFNRIEFGERYYEFTMDEIYQWLMNPKTLNIKKRLLKDSKKLAVAVAESLPEVRKNLPDIPYNPKLSYVFGGKEKKNCCLADADENGNIIIFNITLDMNDFPNYFIFLASAMERYIEHLSDDGKLYITVTTDRQDEILRALSFGHKFNYSCCVNMARTIGEKTPEKFEMPHVALLIPRINSISRMLSDFGDGYENTVTYTKGDAIINLVRSEDKPEIYLHYEVEDAENDEDFVLSMITCINKSELTKEQLESLSMWKEESILCSFTEDEDHLFASAAIIENRGPVSPELLKTVLDGFMREIDNLCTLDRLTLVRADN